MRGTEKGGSCRREHYGRQNLLTSLYAADDHSIPLGAKTITHLVHRKMLLIPGQGCLHDLTKRWFGVHFVMAVALQNDQFLGFASTGIELCRFLGGNKTVIVSGDEQNRARGNLIHNPFRVEA